MIPSKVPVVNKSDYTILLENLNNEAVFVHCYVYSWSKTVRQNLKKDFNLLLNLQNGPIFAFHDKEDKKHRKFLNIFNFQYVKDIECVDGKQRELYMVTGESNG